MPATIGSPIYRVYELEEELEEAEKLSAKRLTLIRVCRRSATREREKYQAQIAELEEKLNSYRGLVSEREAELTELREESKAEITGLSANLHVARKESLKYQHLYALHIGDADRLMQIETEINAYEIEVH